tara:strand:+ start:5673 stop:5804 length:132 start_codon:yes stop_codon:yes gene_type:complete
MDKKIGWFEIIELMNNTKAELLYNEIDEIKLFRCQAFMSIDQT